jgi:uncharacterized membrane protein
LITIELDLTTILVAAVSSLVSIAGSAVVTWYFSKRHYTGRDRQITENDILLQQNNNEFRIVVLVVIGVFLPLVLIVMAGICGVQQTTTEEDDTAATRILQS